MSEETDKLSLDLESGGGSSSATGAPIESSARCNSASTAMVTATMSPNPNPSTSPGKTESDNSRHNSVAAALPASTIAFTYRATKGPKDTLKAVYKAGEYKAGLPLHLLMVQCFMAGIYIGAAGQLYLTVGAGLLGSALFPTGLIAVILTSAELFTGDSLVFVASVLGRKVTLTKLARNWTVSWILNFAGCLFWSFFLAYLSEALQDAGQVELAIKIAEKKVHQTWAAIFLKGIGANFMVCVGVWQATCAEEVSGKVLALWFPITAFVAMGFDHAIANMFLIPTGMMFGADITVGRLFWALLPATLGNIVGGGVMVGGVYWYVYDSMASSKLLIGRVRDSLLGRQSRMTTQTTDKSETVNVQEALKER